MIQRLTVQQTAIRLGLSSATVRRMIRAGQLQAEREVRPQGSRWIVLWDDDAHASAQASTPGHATSQTPDALHVALATIEDLRRRLDASEQAQAELRRMLAGALRALPEGRAELQPVSEPLSETPEPPAPGTPRWHTDAPQAGRPRPWWRRWGRR
jgi:excisionase family DNA binding protein